MMMPNLSRAVALAGLCAIGALVANPLSADEAPANVSGIVDLDSRQQKPPQDAALAAGVPGKIVVTRPGGSFLGRSFPCPHVGGEPVPPHQRQFRSSPGRFPWRPELDDRVPRRPGGARDGTRSPGNDVRIPSAPYRLHAVE